MAQAENSEKMRSFTEDELRKFLLSQSVSKKVIDQLLDQDLDGQMLHDFQVEDFEKLGIKKAPAVQLVNIRDKFLLALEQAKAPARRLGLIAGPCAT